MLCTVIKSFKNSRGETVSPGSTIDVPDSMMLKMAAYVQPAGQSDHPAISPKGSILNVTASHNFGNGDPVTCPYWFRVCWAVGMYQKQCTRSSDCTVYKFLKRQEDTAPDIDTNPPF